MDQLSISERYGLGYQQAEDRNDLKKYLRRTISDSQKKIKTLLKNPNKEIVTFNSEDGPQRSTNRELANEHKEVKKSALKDLNQIQKQEGREDPKKMTRDKVTGEAKRKRIFTRKMVGRGGGGSMKMPQEYSKRSLLKKPMS
tara:strand:- start:25 stop:450 length:426 start_codon:yes stop_codon:yes gene_type:complete